MAANAAAVRNHEAVQRDCTFTIRPIAEAAPAGAVRTVARTRRASDIRNTLDAFPSPVLLSIDARYFHAGSAVVMPDTTGHFGADTPDYHWQHREYAAKVTRHHPDYFERPWVPADDGERQSTRISGLGVLAAAYRFAALNSGYRLLIAGHSDAAESDDFDLSARRARNVLHLLTGNRQSWAEEGSQHSRPEDIRRILGHVARVRSWPCAPISGDDRDGRGNNEAVRQFAKSYNREFSATVPTDGSTGHRLWQAMFDLYIDEIQRLLPSGANDVATQRGELRFAHDDSRWISCGRMLPMNVVRPAERVDGDRRVELLFFKSAYVPDFSCHESRDGICMRNCRREHCHVYSPEFCKYVYLDPLLRDAALTRHQEHGQFSIETVDFDFNGLHSAPPSEPQRSEPRRATDADTNPWAFLDPFAEEHPGAFLSESSEEGEAHGAEERSDG